MDNTPSPDINNQAAETSPETLQTRAVDGAVPPPEATPPPPEVSKKLHRRAYRPSHRATFIGLAVVVAILAINIVVLGFILKGKDNASSLRDKVTISPAVLDKLGVSSSNLGSAGTKLTVGPDSDFKGKVNIAGDTNISGGLNLNGKLSGTNANFTQLQGGNTSLSQLNVNGDGTLNNLNLRSQLIVAGKTQLQGAVTINQLLTVFNNLTVTGNLSIGGTFSARSLASNSTLVVGGHIITSGTAPAISPGNHLGSNGTVSISGNDASGTVAVNLGVGGGGGWLATITFNTAYSNIPHVTVTPIGGNVGNFYITRGSTNFSIYITGSFPSGGSVAFDYIVEQ